MLELAREADYEAVNRISQQVLMLHVGWRPDIFRPASSAFSMEFFRETLKKQALYVARRNNQVVGYLLAFTRETNSPGSIPSKLLNIDEFCVDQDYRRRGIGREMMADILDIARGLGCSDMQLSVYPQNEAAISFYEKCGFRVRNIRYQKSI